MKKFEYSTSVILTPESESFLESFFKLFETPKAQLISRYEFPKDAECEGKIMVQKEKRTIESLNDKQKEILEEMNEEYIRILLCSLGWKRLRRILKKYRSKETSKRLTKKPDFP